MMFDSWRQWLQDLQGDSYWITQVFLIVLATLIVNFVWKLVYNKLHSKLELTQNRWDDALIAAVRAPLSLLIWTLGLVFAIELMPWDPDDILFAKVSVIRDVVIIGLLGWFVVRLVNQGEENLLRQTPEDGPQRLDQTTVNAVSKILRASVLITTTLVVLQRMGIDITGVIAFGGIGGIIVGMAAKDLLANFFGGLMIYLDRPFKVGDWVRSPDREIEGTVEHIGWRLTRIRTFDKRPLYVPNAMFNSIALENPSRMLNRRIHETIGVRYDDVDKIDDIINDVRKMLQTHPEIDTSQTLMVNFNKFAASSLDFFIYTFTKTTDWVRFHEIKHDVLLKISNIITEHKAEVAFPTSTLHVHADSVDRSILEQMHREQNSREQHSRQAEEKKGMVQDRREA